MKKNIFLVGLVLILCACSDPSKVNDAAAPKADESKAQGQSSAASNNPDYDKGLQLVAKSDCMGCHKINEMSIGPSYAAVAAKYEANDANVALLASKIMKGGQGVWGEVPMAPHADLSQQDAVQMVKYILLLKDEQK